MKQHTIFSLIDGFSNQEGAGPSPPSLSGESIVTDRVAREEIQHRAYAIWMSEGQPPDRGLEHWLRAESEVVGRA